MCVVGDTKVEWVHTALCIKAKDSMFICAGAKMIRWMTTLIATCVDDAKAT